MNGRGRIGAMGMDDCGGGENVGLWCKMPWCDATDGHQKLVQWHSLISPWQNAWKTESILQQRLSVFCHNSVS